MKSVTNPMGQKFLKTVAKYFKQVTKHATPIKYVLFSGHDSSIMSVMNALGKPLDQIPEYASRLNFSLFVNGSRYQVKVTYNDNSVFIPACNRNTCTLEQFDKFTNGS